MQTTSQTSQNTAELLSEILPLPSNKIIADRFSQDETAAFCTGKCQNGHCKGSLDQA